MELNEKELACLERHQGVFYSDCKFQFLCDPDVIKMRKESKDLAEFKRRILEVESDQEVEQLKKAWRRYNKLNGYMQIFEIKDED